jgi:hypothetical protein
MGGSEILANALRDHMPHLDEIWMSKASANMDDDKITTLLTGSRKGWKNVTLYRTSVIGESTMKALFSTRSAAYRISQKLGEQ